MRTPYILFYIMLDVIERANTRAHDELQYFVHYRLFELKYVIFLLVVYTSIASSKNQYTLSWK